MHNIHVYNLISKELNFVYWAIYEITIFVSPNLFLQNFLEIKINNCLIKDNNKKLY